MLHLHCWHKTAIFSCLILFLSVSNSAPAQAKTRHHARHLKHHRVLPVDGDAQYADLIIEARTGRILHAMNATEPRHPASLTKMMTLYLTFQALDSGRLSLNQQLHVSSRAAAQSPSKLGLHPGQTIRVQDAILGVVTESANDAAVVLAETQAGSEDNFAMLMTRQARALGMKQTTFQNASGLPDSDQVSTAQDMAILGYALIYHHPRYYAFFGHESFIYAGRMHKNHNHLMERYEGMDGIKTGYVRASGFNLVASAVRGNRRLIGVVFGGRSTVARDNQMAQLLDQAFATDEGATQTAQAQNGTEAQGDYDDSVDSQYAVLPPKGSGIIPAGFNIAENKGIRQGHQGAWGIQIGAYNDVAVGQQSLAALTQNMTPLLNRADPLLQKIQMSDGSAVYRARFTGMEQASARSVCAYLVKHGQGCLVVAPEQTGG
jgi:D-alanyl-D-alanine carboxypeptidase